MADSISTIDSQIIQLYRKILKNCKISSAEADLVNLKLAYDYTKEHSGSIQQQIDKPHIIKTLETADIISGQFGLGTTSIIASLLFEFLAEGLITKQEIAEKFGVKISEICDGLAKISHIKSEKSSSQGENLRNLILTLARDVRVILVKLAERLYLLRNLDNYKKEDQIQFASEVRYIYSPLAHRMGLYNVMSEMEDLCMKYLETDSYRDIETKLQNTRAARNKFIKEFIKPLDEELAKAGLKAEVKGRPKAISSIWRKMKKQKVDFEEVYDKFAIRIILDSKAKNEKSDCWRAYSIVTDQYKPNPERLRDWISMPKSNGYESLHTTVIVPGGNWVEVQIRSKQMDEIAEKGLAAHWKYKGIKGEAVVDEWLSKVREMLDNPESDALNIIDDMRLSLDNKEIFVFTPKGDLKKFPEGASILDFAFDIHTDVGASCVGAKINGLNKPIRYQLQNGDKIEIITSKNQKINVDWLNYVVSSKAKSKIKLALKEEKLKEVENGKEILKRRFKNWKLEFGDPLIRKLIKHYKYKDALDLYYNISTEKINLLEIKNILTSGLKVVEGKSIPIVEEDLEKIIKSDKSETSDFLIIDDSLSGVDYHLAKCCNPIFGDKVFGFVTINTGITIHRINCPNAQELISRYGYRIVAAKWTESDKDRHFLATLRIMGIDDIGIVSNISEVISKDLKVNMRSFAMESGDGLFEGTVHIFVRDTVHLDVLVRKLGKVKGVMSVKRLS
ncbi:MAG: RelA/SpoT family protein [Bacteroidales bacterium]|nr:RelA/SpoT family protein [Bacteroidales bacterium]MCF8391837.1 RelA/SpoT family protein [Bacteroidales bacterium]